MRLAAVGGKKGHRSGDPFPLRGTVFVWERSNPTGCPGNVRLDNVSSGLCVQHTGLTL